MSLSPVRHSPKSEPLSFSFTLVGDLAAMLFINTKHSRNWFDLTLTQENKTAENLNWKPHAPSDWYYGWIVEFFWYEWSRRVPIVWSDISEQTINFWWQYAQTPNSSSWQLQPDQRRLNSVRSLPGRMWLDRRRHCVVLQLRRICDGSRRFATPSRRFWQWCQTLSTSDFTKWPVDRNGVVNVWASIHVDRRLARWLANGGCL